MRTRFIGQPSHVRKFYPQPLAKSANTFHATTSIFKPNARMEIFIDMELPAYNMGNINRVFKFRAYLSSYNTFTDE